MVQGAGVGIAQIVFFDVFYGLRQMKRVLVTGATGFIGRHVLEPLLGRGYEVHGSSRSRRIDVPPDIVLHSVDLLAPGSPADLIRAVRPTHLLHLAWIPDPGRILMALENLSWAAASLELYRAFVEGDGQRAVIAGSCAEYDWSYELLHETQTPSRPSTIYGAAKNAVRQAVEMAGRHSGVGTAWARIFFLYGPHEPRRQLVPEVASALLAGRLVETTYGRQERDFLHVADAAEALAKLLDSPVLGTVNVASGECVPIHHVVEVLGDLTGRPDLLAIGARPSPACEAKRLAADITRLSREVGFVPRYGLEEGLSATLSWWRTVADR